MMAADKGLAFVVIIHRRQYSDNQSILENEECAQCVGSVGYQFRIDIQLSHSMSVCLALSH
jgi:hypothetical protein